MGTFKAPEVQPPKGAAFNTIYLYDIDIKACNVI